MNNRTVTAAIAAAFALTLLGCGGSKAPTAPAPLPAANLSAPALDSPGSNEQLDSLRPTLTVIDPNGNTIGNVTSPAAGTPARSRS